MYRRDRYFILLGYIKNYNLHCIASSILVLLSPHVLFTAMLSSPTPTDLSLYHHVDHPSLMYSTRVRVNSRDVLLLRVGDW